MANQEQFQIALGRIDAATNNIALTLKDLKDKLTGQGLPPETEDWVLAQLDGAATKLEGIGKTESGGEVNTGVSTETTEGGAGSILKTEDPNV